MTASFAIHRHVALGARSWVRGSLAAFERHGLLAAIVAAQIAIYATLHVVYPQMRSANPWDLVATASELGTFILPICILTICLGRMVRARPKGSPTAALLREVWRYISDRDRLANGVPVIVLFVPFSALFASLKIAIPLIQPFAWDKTFSAWDRALFLGALPHEVLSPLMGHPIVLFATNVAYNVWFVLMLATLVACAFMKSRTVLRTRYLVAFFLVWLVEGNILALLLSSAGPCFYGLIGLEPNPYLGLMASLREADATAPIYALRAQGLLWSGHIGEGAPVGISAMPSLHNGVAILMALAASQLGARLGLAFAAYAVWIFLGSISLAWHYAVDGLVALPATILIWIFSGHLARWWHQARERCWIAPPPTKVLLD